MLEEPRKTHRRGSVPMAMRRVARQLLDADEMDGVGLREAARLVGVSATAIYRHFESKEEWLAAVAAEGFLELAAALRMAADGPDAAVAVGLAYVDFALTNRGLFRLMFGPLLLQKDRYSALDDAVAEMRDAVVSFGTIEDQGRGEDGALSAWGLYQGLSGLLLGNLLSGPNTRALAQRVLASAGR